MAAGHFDVIILIGRPASGKSEIIDFLRYLPHADRSNRFHLGEFRVLDDFPMLWTWFEEDAILTQKLGKPALHTDENGDFKYDYLWDLLIERLGLEYNKLMQDEPAYHKTSSLIVEFSRGVEHGGYKRAFDRLSPELLSRAGILYVDVSFEESLRKNRRRFNPDKPHSILEHGLPDEKLKRLYGEDDFRSLVSGAAGFLEVQSVRVPFVVFQNEDDVTTGRADELARRLDETLNTLWGIYHR